MLRFRDFGVFVFDLECFVFEFWVLRFRVLGASFSSFGCFVLRSSFSSASFSKLPFPLDSLPTTQRGYYRGETLSLHKLCMAFSFKCFQFGMSSWAECLFLKELMNQRSH